MSVDKFGRYSLKRKKSEKNEIIQLDENGRIDFDGKQIVNIGIPSYSTDIVTKEYVDKRIIDIENYMNFSFILLKKNKNDYIFDAKLKNIGNVKTPIAPSNAANKLYVDNKLNNLEIKINKLLEEKIKPLEKKFKTEDELLTALKKLQPIDPNNLANKLYVSSELNNLETKINKLLEEKIKSFENKFKTEELLTAIKL